jgi:integrase
MRRRWPVLAVKPRSRSRTVCGLRTEVVDLVGGVVWVRKNRVELLESPKKYDKDPKTDAGRREVAFPPHLKPYLVEHMQKWAGSERFFIGRDGQPMQGNAVYRRSSGRGPVSASM